MNGLYAPTRPLLMTMLATTLFFAPASAYAGGPIDAKGAEAVKTMLNTRLDQAIATAKINSVHIMKKGDLKVEPQGTYYSVTYPALAATLVGQKQVGRVDIGTPTLNIMPGDKDKQWKVTIAMPNPIRFTDGKGAEVGKIEIGTQKISAILDENYDQPMMANVLLGNVALTGGDKSGSIKFLMPEIIYNLNYTEQTPNIFNGVVNFAIHTPELLITDNAKANDQIKITAADITSNGTYDQVDLAALRAFNTKMAELGDAGLDPNKFEKSPESAMAFLTTMMDAFTIMDGATGDIKVTQLAVTGQDSTTKQPIDVRIGEISYGGRMNGLKSEKSTGDIHWAVRDVVPTGVPPEYVKFIPKDTTLKFGWQNLPLKAILAQFSDVMKEAAASAKDPNAAQNMQMKGMGLVMRLPGMLGQAGTSFTLNDTKVANDNYDLTGDGTFTANAAAVYAGTGALKIVFTGLDQLITDLQTLAKDPAHTKSLSDALQSLAQMQKYGQQGAGTGGKPARIYDLSVDAQGVTKLNGTDLKTLMMPVSPDVATPAQAPSR